MKRIAKPSDYTLDQKMTHIFGEPWYVLNFDDTPKPGNPTNAPEKGALEYNKHIADIKESTDSFSDFICTIEKEKSLCFLFLKLKNCKGEKDYISILEKYPTLSDPQKLKFIFFYSSVVKSSNEQFIRIRNKAYE